MSLDIRDEIFVHVVKHAGAKQAVARHLRTMDNGFEDAPGPQLSYDDSVPYNEQVSSLAERISSTKVYLLADASNAKRKPAEDNGEDEMDTDQGTCSLSRFPRLLSYPQQTHFSVETPSSSKALPSHTSPPPAYSTTQLTLTFTPSVSNGSTTTRAYSSFPQKP